MAQDHAGKFLVHLDKPFYVSGEQALYKLFVPSALAVPEAVVQVTLLQNDSDRIVTQYYHRIKDKPYVSGLYTIPLDAVSGNYTLAFAMSSTDQKKMMTVSSISLPIISDLNDDVIPVNLSGGGINLPDSELKIEFQANDNASANSNYELTVTDLYGRPVKADLSISIVSKEMHYGQSGETPVVAQLSESKNLSSPGKKISYYGQCLDQQGNPVKNPILAVYSKETQQFSYTKSNAEGYFFLELPDFSGDRSMQFVRYVDYDSDVTYKLSNDAMAVTSQSKLSSDVLSAYRTESQTLKRVNQYFDTGFAIQEQTADKIRHTDEAPTSQFKFSEYRAFNNLGNFFKELLTPLTYKVDGNGIYSAKLRNPAAQRNRNFQLSGSPLFIVDGLVTKDANYVARIDFNDVDEVELFCDPTQLDRMYKVMGQSGVVRVTTTLPDYKLSEDVEDDFIYISGLKDNVAEVKFAELNNANHDAPIFRPQLYWNPTLTTDATGKAVISVPHSDDSGNYVITVLARSDREEIGYSTYMFSFGQSE